MAKTETAPKKGTKSLPRLKEKYLKEIAPKLVSKFGNPMRVPKVTKVVINMGVGQATQNAKLLEAASRELTTIAGQKPVITRAKKSISNFKLRAGVPIGCRVTLRGDMSYYFLDKLFTIVVPRIRDFRGLSPKAFDGRGNYSLGLQEQLVFPEINYDSVEKVQGMNITIVTTAKNDGEAKELLEMMGMPFRKPTKKQ
ncbi:MAG: large subunit ribosomal protein [Clostridiales bacterium]|jgi:large subunit ribosomal protein L5|nr:large subunit ribosomal protein [Clostridiales bacterium]MDN5280946.1 large subunit ribosomal protein [Candidatus Ozemobacter sp.]